MYIGIDLGTSGLKVILKDEGNKILDSNSYPLQVSRPNPLWSEQNPEDWWTGLTHCLKELSERNNLSKVKAIGVTGQMHGAVLVDAQGEVIRPAILWNDGRSHKECEELERIVPDAREITGNLMMPGFTAPKLLWVKNHEPEHFNRIHKVLLPKDYLRYRLTGDYATDCSDSAGTLWLNVAKRRWSPRILSACGLTEEHMPTLFEGTEISGQLTDDVGRQWQLGQVPVVAGAGDCAAGAIGVGITKPGQAMISLGTSGVFFVASDAYHAKAETAVHSFCHALPGAWHTMSVILSAASSLSWFADDIAKMPVSKLLEELESAKISIEHNCLFLPYLAGERTPHNDPEAKGIFFGLTHNTDRAAMTHAVLEGVTFAIADGYHALKQAGVSIDSIALIGGGARSAYWRQMFADVLNLSIDFRDGGEVGPSLGAARLAQIGFTKNANIEDICPVPELVSTYEPNTTAHAIYESRYTKYKTIYRRIHDLF